MRLLAPNRAKGRAMSNSNLNFFNRSGNSPTVQREYHRKRDEGRKQDRIRKQVERANANTPGGKKVLERIVGDESVGENIRIAAANKVLATSEFSTNRGAYFNDAPSGCGKLVYTSYTHRAGAHYSSHGHGKRVKPVGATPADNSKDGAWVSYRDTQTWQHPEHQRQYHEEKILDALVKMHFRTVDVDGDDYSECDLCKQLIWWPRDCQKHIEQVHGSRKFPSHNRRLGNVVAKYRKQLKADPEADKK